jgi:hypothetical protein
MKPDLLAEAKLGGFLEAAKRRAADEFFSDPGLPEPLRAELAEGWAVLEQRRREREKSGIPLTPGACVVLGVSSVYAQAMADFHNRLAGVLDVPPQCVRLRREDDSVFGGLVHVVADVELPEGWPRECDDAHRLKAYMTCALHGNCPDDKFEQVLRNYESGELKLAPDLVQQYLNGLIGELNIMFRREMLERLEALQTVRVELVPWDADGVPWCFRPDGAAE